MRFRFVPSVILLAFSFSHSQYVFYLPHHIIDSICHTRIFFNIENERWSEKGLWGTFRKHPRSEYHGLVREMWGRRWSELLERSKLTENFKIHPHVPHKIFHFSTFTLECDNDNSLLYFTCESFFIWLKRFIHFSYMHEQKEDLTWKSGKKQKKRKRLSVIIFLRKWIFSYFWMSWLNPHEIFLPKRRNFSDVICVCLNFMLAWVAQKKSYDEIKNACKAFKICIKRRTRVESTWLKFMKWLGRKFVNYVTWNRITYKDYQKGRISCPDYVNIRTYLILDLGIIYVREFSI